MSKTPLQAFAGATSGLLAADEADRMHLHSPERIGETTKQVTDRSLALSRQACAAPICAAIDTNAPSSRGRDCPGPDAELGAEASERAKLAGRVSLFEGALGCSTRA